MLLVVRRLYDWSYAQTEHFVGDSLVLRQFCRVYLERVPDDTTLIRWAQCVGPRTLEQLHERVVALAHQAKVTRGRKLRVDGTVMETTIHYPTDSSLLCDGVRVVSRLLQRARVVVGTSTAVAAGSSLFRDRTRSATRLARQIQESVRRRNAEGATGQQAAYHRLLRVARASLRQAQQVHQRLQAQFRTPLQASLPTGQAGSQSGQQRTSPVAPPGVRLVTQLAHVTHLVDRVISQTLRLRGARLDGARARKAGEPLRTTHTHHPARHSASPRRIRPHGVAG